MNSAELQFDWLYRLKRKILFSIFAVLALSIVATMGFIGVRLQQAMVAESRVTTRELAVTVNANLRQLMLLRSPEATQETLSELVAKNPTISDAFIVNNQGEVVYASDPDQIGWVFDRNTAADCTICHDLTPAEMPHDVIVEGSGSRTHRNISLIRNEPACHDCHDAGDAINGKLVIDHSLQSTFDLISEVQLVLVASGVVCLLLLVPILSGLLNRGIDKYILEIFSRNEELRLLYVMVERLSKTLDSDLLKEIVVDIFREVLGADRVDLVVARGELDYSASAWHRSRGRLERKKLEPGSEAEVRTQAWLAGELKQTEVDERGRTICMPISKGAHRLALIFVTREQGRFEADRLRLCSVIGSHIAVAFDNARLYQIAITDELTGTYTKRHFRGRIEETFADFDQFGNKFALLMMDLDHFKQVNDSYGHFVGDSVLRALGEIIRRSVRDNDQVFRYGGEEFAVILPETDSAGAHFVAERIRRETEATVFEPGTIDLRLTVSVGFATCPEQSNVRDLIVAADGALYQAKGRGRNRVVAAGGGEDEPVGSGEGRQE
jgi:diguanylate cyclase (GGDEF)-like protein